MAEGRARWTDLALTLPSSGHATACHAWPPFHSGPCASCRCVPLMSNVMRPLFHTPNAIEMSVRERRCEVSRARSVAVLSCSTGSAREATLAVHARRSGAPWRANLCSSEARARTTVVACAPSEPRAAKRCEDLAVLEPSARRSAFWRPLRANVGRVVQHAAAFRFPRAGSASSYAGGVRRPSASRWAAHNPSFKRTHNGGPRLLASAMSAAPLCAA
jgi:hypothetical protein